MMRAALRAVLLLWAAAGTASACAPDALGTARVLTLKREHARYGTAQYGPLPLQKGEVVLTFDDGPVPGATDKVLQALAQQCTQATFFMTGANLSKYPELGLRVERAGHAVALHSFAHPSLKSMAGAEQLADLELGTQAFTRVFGHVPAAYRFPYLEETPPILAALKDRGVTVASVDLGIDDWAPNDMRVDSMVARLLDRLKQAGGGIILMHDANGPTGDALPAMLKAIRDNGYKVVSLRWEDSAGLSTP
ncbi:polysaccharide deacetylase family protein [Pseudoduganella sp. R-43]|uniref:polysaccharide deacetylase family protein n=1 Tax=unclassified Pseudoduganella TaxID=2637179 RepID=UPI003CF7A27A